MRNQRKDVLEYLQRNGSITQIEAYREFEAPITRLAAVIHDLRKQGYDIETPRLCYYKLLWNKSLCNVCVPRKNGGRIK